jgi:hypothetical protein
MASKSSISSDTHKTARTKNEASFQNRGAKKLEQAKNHVSADNGFKFENPKKTPKLTDQQRAARNRAKQRRKQLA